jgi:hypothetical protein
MTKTSVSFIGDFFSVDLEFEVLNAASAVH